MRKESRIIGRLIWSVLPILAVLSPARGEPNPAGELELGRREWGRYRSRLPASSEVRWQAEWELRRISAGPPSRYFVRDHLRGRFGDENLPQTRTTEAEFILAAGRTKMLHSLLTVRDPAGNILFTLEKEFDYRKREVETRKKYPGSKKVEIEKFEMEDRLVDAKEIVSALRGFPFPPQESVESGAAVDGEMEFDFLNQTPDTYSVLVTYEGTEEVQTPAGQFFCHRLRIVPDLGILTFVGKIFAPDLYMWFTVDPPHYWVRYRGLEGDLSTPSLISELVEFNIATGEE